MAKEETMNQLDMAQFSGRDLRMTSKVSKNGNHWYEFIRVACPICGHTGNCIVNETGTAIICTRCENKHPYGTAWYYSLKYSAKTNQSNAIRMSKHAPDVKQASHANDNQLDKVYRLLLLYYGLTKADFKTLTSQRHLSEETIKHHHYATFTESKRQVVRTESGKIYSIWHLLFKKIGIPLDSWLGVPGFYGVNLPDCKELLPIFNTVEGTLIPFRNASNLITGLQVRVHKIPVYIKVINKQFKSMAYKIHASADGSFTITDRYGEEITTGFGVFHQENTVQLPDGMLTFKMSKGAKYIWVTSVHKLEGCGPSGDLGLPCQVDLDGIYQTLRLEAPANFRQQPKTAWITEGGLKTDVATEQLSQVFTTQELDKFGHMIIGVPGTSTWRPLLKLIADLNITRVTLAYDADFVSNKAVQTQYSKLISALSSRVVVQIAIWNINDGKGIDDCLVNRKRPKIICLNA